jgi:hypothetical protein
VGQQVVAGDFTLVNALSTLLTTESLMFASFALAVNLTAPSRGVRDWLIPPKVLAGAAVFTLAFVAFGAGVAWHGIFVVGGFPSAAPEQIIALAIIAAIVMQPLLAFFLALGLRTKS